MKQLKRLELKKCTTLNSAEMKQILGGMVTTKPPTCNIFAEVCSGNCKDLFGKPGVCLRNQTNRFCYCQTDPFA